MTTYRDYTDEEIGRRGEAIYEQHIRPLVEAENHGKYVTINIETGEWEMGEESSLLTRRLHARHPEAPLYTLRVGYPFAVQLGGRYVSPR